MYIVFGILGVIVALCIISYAVLMTVVQAEMKRYSDYIHNGTIFICKESPDITCSIDYIYWDDIINSRIRLNVKYPSGSTCSLLTTTGAFDDVWEEK